MIMTTFSKNKLIIIIVNFFFKIPNCNKAIIKAFNN